MSHQDYIHKLVVVYRDTLDSSHGKANIITVSGTDISIGDSAKFVSNSSGVRAPSVVRIGQDTIVAEYNNITGDDYGHANIGQIVNDTDITFGIDYPYETGSNGMSHGQLVRLEDGKCAVLYKDLNGSPSVGDFTTRIGLLSGDTIAWGPEYSPPTSHASRVTQFGQVALDSTHIVQAWHGSDFSEGFLVASEVSGTTVTYGPEVSLGVAGQRKSFNICALSSDKFVVMWMDELDGSHGLAAVGTVSGTTITMGPEVTFVPAYRMGNGTGKRSHIVSLSETKVVVTYLDGSDAGHGTCKVGTISGDTISFGAEAEFTTSVNELRTTKLSDHDFIIAYIDSSDSHHGTLKIGTVSGTTVSFGSETEFVSTNGMQSESLDIALIETTFIPVLISTSGDLFVDGTGFETQTANLYTVGPAIGSGTLTSSLFINGFEPKPELECPSLDPSASIQIKDSLIKIYQSRIDALINQLGKNVHLEFDPIRTPCPNCYFDKVRNRSTGIYIPGGPRPFLKGRKCPWCKGRGLLETPVTKCIKCLVKWNPSDAENFGISISRKKGIVRFKAFLTDADDLIRAKTVMANFDIANQLKLRVKLIQGPTPVGLREDRYCISFWELL